MGARTSAAGGVGDYERQRSTAILQGRKQHRRSENNNKMHNLSAKGSTKLWLFFKSRAGVNSSRKQPPNEGLARASAQQRVCLCLAIRRGSPFSQRAQCALLDKVKTQMECKKDVLERDDDSATMAALFPLWCLGLFFLSRPKTSAARFVGGGRGSGKQEAIQTNQSIINTNCERHML